VHTHTSEQVYGLIVNSKGGEIFCEMDNSIAKFQPFGHDSVDGFGTLWWDIYRTASFARGTSSLHITKETIYSSSP
jgi:hypothetical protein